MLTLYSSWIRSSSSFLSVLNFASIFCFSVSDSLMRSSRCFSCVSLVLASNSYSSFRRSSAKREVNCSFVLSILLSKSKIILCISYLVAVKESISVFKCALFLSNFSLSSLILELNSSINCLFSAWNVCCNSVFSFSNSFLVFSIVLFISSLE